MPQLDFNIGFNVVLFFIIFFFLFYLFVYFFLLKSIYKPLLFKDFYVLQRQFFSTQQNPLLFQQNKKFNIELTKILIFSNNTLCKI